METVRRIAPVFGGINLEDISAPRCFEIETGLQDLGIPVFHDDQHGTAIVLLAALINASKVVGRELTEMSGRDQWSGRGRNGHRTAAPLCRPESRGLRSRSRGRRLRLPRSDPS